MFHEAYRPLFIPSSFIPDVVNILNLAVILSSKILFKTRDPISLSGLY